MSLLPDTNLEKVTKKGVKGAESLAPSKGGVNA
jgi:hypothetical protein